MFSLTYENGIARITIDRGEKRNAVPMAQWGCLEKLIAQANTSEAQAIVFASADPESFCSGSDLDELIRLKDDPKLRRCFRGSMESVFTKIRAVNKPTVAIIRGGCFGTGMSLAGACDIRVAHPGATFSITPARFGIAYPQSDVDRLVTLVGAGQAARLLFTCVTISADEALRIGLVEQVDDGDDVGSELVQGIASNSSLSLRTLKAMLQGRAGTHQAFDMAFASSDFSERIVARSGCGVAAKD
jgi:enoyl-CoA hydratase/carnithine racemase